MKCSKMVIPVLSIAAVCMSGCSKSDTKPAAAHSKGSANAPAVVEHTHGTGPTGGVVMDLGSHHAEFTVNHDKKEVTIIILGDDEKTPSAVDASGFVLNIKESKTAEDKVVPPMTIMMQPVDGTDGKAAVFVGTDPGLANVADFAGTVSGEIDNKPAMGEFKE